MKIGIRLSNTHIGRLIRARIRRLLRSKQQAPGENAAPVRTDAASLSRRREELRAAVLAAKAAKGPNEARLAGLAAQLRNGHYRPPAEAVAERILRDLER